MAGDLHVDTVTTCVRGTLTTCADVTLTTTAGSILDGHNGGAGGTTVNVIGNTIDLLALGGSIGRFTERTTGVFTGDLKIDSAGRGSGCQEHLQPAVVPGHRRRPGRHGARATSPPRPTPDIYLTELDGPAERAARHALRPATSASRRPRRPSRATTSSLLHSGTTLVASQSAPHVPNGRWSRG